MIRNAPSHRTWLEIVEANPEHSKKYARRWAQLEREGRDIYGEARLVDASVPRGAKILDAGCGQGRVGGFLQERGHEVVGIDIDSYLVSVAKRIHPKATWLVGDVAAIPAVLEEADRENEAFPHKFDAIVCAGNVMTFVADEARLSTLESFAAVLNDGGRALVGFGADRGLNFDYFMELVEHADLRADACYSTWDLRPFQSDSNFMVAMLSKA